MQPENNGDRFGDPLRGAAVPPSPGAANVAPQPSERSVSGRIRHSDSSSVAGAALTLIDQSGRQVSRGTGRDDGSYVIGAPGPGSYVLIVSRSEEHTSELQSRFDLVCRLLLAKN